MADVKNFGLKGIGSDVQFGKKGGRLKYSVEDTVTVFSALAEDGTTLIPVRGASATRADHFITKGEFDALATTGLDVKLSARLVSQTGESLGTWSSTGGGTFAGPIASDMVDGVTVVAGDRILVRYIDITDNAGVITVGANAYQNGIYTVTGTAGSFTLVRSADQNTDAEIGYNNYVFVTEGTNAGDSYVTSNYTGLSNLDLTLNTDPVVWVLFNNAATYTASNGVQKVGADFRLDIDSLTTATSTLSDTIAIGDGTSTDKKSTLQSVFNTHNVVYGVTANGFLKRTADDTYASVTIEANTDVDLLGINVTEAGSTLDIGLDINGLATAALTTSSELVAYADGTNGNVKRTFANVIADLDLVSSAGITNGLLVKTANDTYVGRSITVNSTTQAGLSVTNGNGVSGNPVLGLDITGLTSVSPALTDELAIFDQTDSSNKKVTVQGLIDLVAGNVLDNEIGEGNTYVTVADAGTGTVTVSVDGSTVTTFAAAGVTSTAQTVTSLAGLAGTVVFTDVDGKLFTDAGMTYNSTSNTLTLSGDVIGAQGSFSSMSITNGGSFGGNVSMAALTATSGNFGTGTVQAGPVTSTGTVSGLTLTAGTGGITDASLSGSGAIIFGDASKRHVDDGSAFRYDTTTNTLYVDNISVTGTAGIGGLNTITATQVPFGSATTGVLEAEAAFTYNKTTDTLSVPNVTLSGSQIIAGTATNGNINFVPNGTGEVVIGDGAAGLLSSDSGQTLEVKGATGLTLNGVAGDVTIKDTAGTAAVFIGSSGANLTVTSGTLVTSTAIKLGTSTDVDVQFVLGTSNLVRVDSASDYTTALGSAGQNLDALVNKGYVENLVTTGATQEAIKSRKVTVPLNANGNTNIGGLLDANASVLQVKVRIVVADTTAELSIGDSTGSANERYMAKSDNDPSATGVYVTECFVQDSSQVQLRAYVTGTAATSGATAEVIVTYRVPNGSV